MAIDFSSQGFEAGYIVTRRRCSFLQVLVGLIYAPLFEHVGRSLDRGISLINAGDGLDLRIHISRTRS